MVPRIALLLVLACALGPQSAFAYMALLRQGAESAEVPNAFDHYGARVAAGDFNGDGFADVAVAAPDENNDIGVGGKHGVVIVSYGSELGITHVGADVLSVGAPSDYNVYFGRGLAAGDFDGDGIDDLAVGVPGLDDIEGEDIGGVWVYSGIDGVGISLAPYVMLDQADCGATVEAGDQFGYTLAAGDMGGDGFDDLFVGSIGEDDDAGLVAFFPGSASGVTSTGSGFAKQSHLGGVDDPGALFGFSLALGDFIDDGHLDLAIGAPYGDENSLLDIGKVYIVRGTALGPVVTGGEILTPLSLGVPLQLGKAFGWSLAAGSFLDANGARPDLAIGEPLFDLTGAVASGRVVVVDYDGVGDNIHVGPIVLDQNALGQQAHGGAAFGWALAAGNIMTSGGIAGPDDYDDLAIGAPNDDVLVPGSTEALYWDNVGSAYIAPGAGSSFSITNVKVIDAMERNDLWFSFDEQLGKSLCFGKFDATGWDNLVIGVPQKNYPAFIDPDTEVVEAGQVYIMAPWRQPANRPHRSSIVYDCANRILYAQRMGQRLTPASTTKALTALIAVEAIQNHDVDPKHIYTIPAWVANKVTGSQYGLFAGEQLSFEDLLHTMIAVSGNDCAYAIGNILTGEDNTWDYNQSTPWNLEHILSDFADIMNQRAVQLGMSPAHHFNNPAGRPYGDHWTTATDMAIFVDAAMQNPMFRDVVGTASWPNVFRLVPASALFPWIPFPPGVFLPLMDDVPNGFYQSIASLDARARGVKGGSNGPSLVTGLFADEVLNGYAKVTVFGVPPYGSLYNLAAELLSLVSTDCEPATVEPSFDPAFPYADGTRVDIPVGDDQTQTMTVQLNPEHTDDLCVEVLRHTQTTPTLCLSASIVRDSEFQMAAAETRSFGTTIDNIRQIGLAVHNYDDVNAVRLNVQAAAIGLDQDIVIPAGDSWVLPTPPPPAPGGAGLDMLIGNTGPDMAHLMVEEMYGYDLSLGQDRTLPPDWKTIVQRDGIFMNDVVRLNVLGCDPDDGNTVDLSMHSPLVGTAVDDVEDTTPVRSTILDLDNYPNPFNPSTTVAFELTRDASVNLRVYDLAGRLVRVLASGQQLSAGRHEVRWTGTDDSDRSVASGVYIVRIDDGRSAQTGRMTLLK
jgi:hypothetical protein